MGFVRRTLYGCKELKALINNITNEIKQWCNNTFSLKDHNHNNQYLGLSTTGQQGNISWWRCSDGLTIMMGVYDSVSSVHGGVNNTISFAKTFQSTPYLVIQPQIGVSQTSDVIARNVTETTFDVVLVNQYQNTSRIMCTWIAIGHTAL